MLQAPRACPLPHPRPCPSPVLASMCTWPRRTSLSHLPSSLGGRHIFVPRSSVKMGLRARQGNGLNALWVMPSVPICH